VHKKTLKDKLIKELLPRGDWSDFEDETIAYHYNLELPFYNEWEEFCERIGKLLGRTPEEINERQEHLSRQSVKKREEKIKIAVAQDTLIKELNWHKWTNNEKDILKNTYGLVCDAYTMDSFCNIKKNKLKEYNEKRT